MTKKNYYSIILSVLFFFIISILSIYSASSNNSLIIKQFIWYFIGFLIIIFLKQNIIKKITDHAFVLYIIGIFFLVLLLFLGKEINGSKCWFQIPGIGSIQPSEFMKLFLILFNANTLYNHDIKYPKNTIKSDILIIFKILVITTIPSILTFLEPDTGMVIIYFIISFIMLFMYGIKKSIFIFLILVFISALILFLYIFFYNQEEFIKLFGTSFFYRIDRLLDWSNKSGMQLTNALAAIKASGLFGFGLKNIPIYIPEAHTDFIFSIYSSTFGLIGTIIIIIIICIFDYNLFSISIKTNNKKLKYLTCGFLAMIIYQQIQNIGMNIGLLPITGITLPFISYGGSSLLSYMIGLSFIINYENKNIINKKSS